ncbi:thioredoxin (plasmid) [Haloarcula hispanica N601]|uniref:Thioredoxin n=3 Tax=Haloarcula hispanica TaxID=51589 RepID=V5TTZ6_HALHI|nr:MULTISPECIES: thioredoxin [Haloarcula]AEM59204.1 thioredoxin [Haloarcula hispanica ATCC 33960]AHB68074.1 thioredoxin [Haloarcula hispanica N601]AJF27602.1 thioredoxin [Haloarcula sp. CBA1115]KAA9404426.1 thioredoxin [Haloarcula sp. CBA1131]KAA9405201.1 thioredoxin [Haloarcula hispanica]
MTDELEEIRRQKLDELRTRGESGSTNESESGDPSEPITVDGKAELSDTTTDHDVVLVDFYADWCGPCQMLEPVVETVAAETAATVAKIDVDANQELAAEYGVRGVPTLLLFADGEPVERLVGMQDESQLRAVIEKYA